MNEPALPQSSLTIAVLQGALRRDPSLRAIEVLSVSIDRDDGQTRVDLQLSAGRAGDAAAIATLSARALRRNGVPGALRVDLYQNASDRSGSMALLASHRDMGPLTPQRVA